MLNNYKGISIIAESKYILTEGLNSLIAKELRIIVGGYEEKNYIDIIKYLIDYIVSNSTEIASDQTIAYYSWLLQFKSEEHAYYDIYEAIKNGKGFIKGGETAITVIRSQSEICSEYSEVTIFPNFSQNIVISKGVYEGKNIEGIRYESPGHMCGWWLITDDYDDNVDSLMNVHYFDVAFKRPDILKYLALPFGYRFLMDKGQVIISKDE